MCLILIICYWITQLLILEIAVSKIICNYRRGYLIISIFIVFFMFIANRKTELMSMDLHIATCHNSNQLQMGKRKKILKTQKLFKKHFSTMHFTCNICTKTFQTKNILQIHMKTVHKGGKYYKCESCGKSFTRGSTLKRHIHTIHEGHKD